MHHHNNFFEFRHFTVFQNDAVLKVTTDSVLLGAGAPHGPYQTILDIGTGTGILSLMMAQRFPHAVIDAVEIDDEAYIIANENINNSKYASQIKPYLMSVQEFILNKNDRRYDLIISNPPYYYHQKLSKFEKKNIQKHSTQIMKDELISIAKSTLSNKGLLALIYPYEEGKQFIAKARLHHLYCNQIIEIFSNEKQSMPKRLLLFLSMNNIQTQIQQLFLYDDNNLPTKNYIALTEPFYQDSHFKV